MAGGLRSQRLAVEAAFVVNGAALSSCWPRLPQIKDAVGATNVELGLALAGTSAGAIAGTALAGVLLRHASTRTVMAGSATALAAALVLPGLAGSALWLALGLAVAGCADGALDVSMNTAGVQLERGAGRPLLNGMHARWSLGAAAGALAGAGAAAQGVSVAAHLAAVGVVLAAVALASAPRLPTLRSRREAEPAAPSRRLAALGVLAVAAVGAAAVEAVPTDWAAIYTHDVAGATPGVAAGAFAAFSIAMIAGRLVGDRAVARFGARRLLIAGPLVSVVGMVLVAAVPDAPAAVAGFALAGAGAAVVFPLLFGAAGRVAGLSTAAGIAVMSSISRVGFLLAPPLVGGAAQLWGLRVAVLLGAVAAAGVALLAPRVQA